MARYSAHMAAVLFVGVMAFAMLANVDAQVSPVGNCWLAKSENEQNVTVFYFGYDNPGTANVTVPVSESNYLTSPTVELGTDPITLFLPSFHNLAQVVVVPAQLADNQTVAVSWVLNGKVITLDSSLVAQQCETTLPLTMSVLFSAVTQASDEAGIAQAFANAGGLTAAQVAATPVAGGVQWSVIISQGGPTSQFEASYNIYSAFVNPNDDSFRAALYDATNATAIEIGGPVTTELPATPVPAPMPLAPQAPIIPSLTPIAHCWEPDTNSSDGHSFMYFGYISTWSYVQTIDADTPENQFIGAPALDSPFPVFYPGINGFVSRLRVRDGSLVQWNLNGSGVLLDGADVDFACDASTNERGLTSVAAWSSGSYNTTSAQDGLYAISTVSRLPVSNIQATWTNVNGGFRGEFNLTAGNEETVYTAMWRTVSDYHLSNSSLVLLWSEAFGSAPSNYSSGGTAKDTFGSDLPPTSNQHVPVAHCWTPGPQPNSKIAYFGYLSNYIHTLSYLMGPNNWIANADGWLTPTTFTSGFNGFSVVLSLNGDAANSNNIAWNLAGNTAVLDVTNNNHQCRPSRPVSFSITYTGVLLTDVDQVNAANQIGAYVKARTEVSDVLVQFDASPLGFYATVTLTPLTDNSQYSSLAAFLTSCNTLNSFSVRSALSSFAGNATVQNCQGTGTSGDALGTTGVTAETKSYGASQVTLFANCWNPNGAGITGYFGYNTTATFSNYIPSTITVSNGGSYDAEVPVVFLSVNDPYAARIVSSTDSITWTVGTQSVTLSTVNTAAQCSGNANATVILSFERTLTQPPEETPIIEFIAQLTGYPDTSIFGTWTFDSNSDFIFTVLFQSLATGNSVLGDAAVAQEPLAAATYLVRQLTDNATATAAIFAASGCHLYSATTASSLPQPQTPIYIPVAIPDTPIAAPVAKRLSGALVFGIIVAVLLGVGIIGGILFYFCKYHKGMCRDEIETRPLLQD